MSKSNVHPEPDLTDGGPLPEDMELSMVGDVGIDPRAEPIRLIEKLEEALLILPQIKAENLVDIPLKILGLKTFNSTFKNQGHCYYAHVQNENTGEQWGVVLGGGQVMEVLDAYVKAGFRNPILCTLRLVQGGAYGRYYVME